MGGTQRSGTPARVAIIGMGVIGGRLARELVSSRPELVVELHSSSADRREAVGEAFGSSAVIRSTDDPVEDTVEVVVLTGAQRDQPSSAAQHIAAGRHVVTTTDDAAVAESLLALDRRCRSKGRSLVIGAVFSPGLSCLLAAFAAGGLDTVEEIHVARHGAAGPLCAQQRLGAVRVPVREWRDGAWVTRRAGSGRELCWFPDPVGGADAYRAATAEPVLLTDAFTELSRSSARLVLSRRDRLLQHLPTLWPAPAEGGVGAIRVEVRGTRADERVTTVLAALDRPGVAAAGVCAEAVLGVLDRRSPVGAHGLGSWSDPGGTLLALRGRGIRVAGLDPTSAPHSE